MNQRGTRALAVQLAHVMASTKTMVKSIGPGGSLPPQYLMPTRNSTLSQLSQNFSLYALNKALKAGK